MISWCIMATGKIAHQFADTLRDMGGEAQFYAVSSRSRKAAEQFAGEYHIAFPDLKAYTHQEMLADPAVQAVYVCSPNVCHYEDVKRCLLAGKHVLCEKPFTCSEREACELTELAAKQQVFLMEGMWIAHLPLIQKMQSMIAEGLLGDIRRISADYGFISSGIRWERKLSAALGGGALMDVGVYTLAFPYLCLKKLPVSYTSTAVFNDGGTDDRSFSLLHYGDGCCAMVSSAIGTVIPQYGTVCGSEGTIFFPDFQEAQQMDWTANDGQSQHYSKPFASTGFEYQIRECERCIENGQLQSEHWNWADTLALQHQMDEIRRCWKEA